MFGGDFFGNAAGEGRILQNEFMGGKQVGIFAAELPHYFLFARVQIRERFLYSVAEFANFVFNFGGFHVVPGDGKTFPRQ